MVSSVSGRLMTASAGAIEGEIRLGLEQVRELLAVDRCALYRVMKDRDAIEIVNQAAAPGCRRCRTAYSPGRAHRACLASLAGREDARVELARRACPPMPWPIRIFYENLKIAALIAIPLSVAGSSNYVLCVTSPRSMEEWPRDLITCRTRGCSVKRLRAHCCGQAQKRRCGARSRLRPPTHAARRRRCASCTCSCGMQIV